MADKEKVIEALQYLISGECTDTQFDYLDEIESAIAMLKEQESEWLEDSDPGQEYGTTWACWKCMHSIHEPFIWNPYDSGYKYCPHCGSKMEVKFDA